MRKRLDPLEGLKTLATIIETARVAEMEVNIDYYLLLLVRALEKQEEWDVVARVAEMTAEIEVEAAEADARQRDLAAKVEGIIVLVDVPDEHGYYLRVTESHHQKWLENLAQRPQGRLTKAEIQVIHDGAKVVWSRDKAEYVIEMNTGQVLDS